MGALALGLMAGPSLGNAQEIQIISSSSIEFDDESTDGSAEPTAPKVGFSFGGPGGMVSFGSGPTDPSDSSALAALLQQEKIRQELGISDSQMAGIQKLQKESGELLQKAVQELMKATKESGGAAQLDHIREARERVRELTERGIEEILLPDQVDRIKQIAFQVEITRMGMGPSLTRGKFGEAVGIRNEQKPELIRLAQELEEETRKKIAAIRAEAREKLIAKLDEEQQQKVEDLLGKYFDYAPPTMDDMIKQVTGQIRKMEGNEDTKAPQ
jgi:ribosome recycling factor